MPRPTIRIDVEGIHDRGLTEMGQGISDICIERYGLSYPDINFHIVDLDTLAGVVAAHGSPVSPETWQLEQESKYIQMSLTHGNQRFYEIVSTLTGNMDEHGNSTEPIDAFIYNVNRPYMTKLVIAHVFGHCHLDFNNRVGLKARQYSGFHSPHTEMVDLSQLVEEEYGRQGNKPVAALLDAVKVLASMVAYNPDVKLDEARCIEDLTDEAWLNPLKRKKTMWEEQLDPVEERAKQAREGSKGTVAFPNERVNNIFDVLKESQGLQPWQRALLVRAGRMELYLINMVAPIKTVHEGFASFVHFRFGVEHPEYISDGELHQFVSSHTSVASSHSLQQLNPYALGFTLLYNVMMRWARGEYGLAYDATVDALRRLNWSSSADAARGWEKVLEVVSSSSDFDLIQKHFDPDYFSLYGQNFYTFSTKEHNSGFGGKVLVDIIDSKEFKEVKSAILFQFCNGGRPFFHVKKGEGDYRGRGELMITHEIDPLPELFGIPRTEFTLSVPSVEQLLKAAYFVTKRPVHLRTIDEHGETLYITYMQDNSGGGSFFENKREAEIK